MKHEEFQVLVSAYHDGEVTAEERALVEGHLAGCGECAEMLTAYGRLGRTVHRLPRGAPSRELWGRVQGGLAARRRWALGWRLLPVAPVLALVAIAVTLFVALGTQPGARFMTAPAGQEVALDKEAQPSPAAPVDSPLVASAPGRILEQVTETYELAALPPCPDGLVVLEVVSPTVWRGEARATPRLEGVLYDAAGQPLSGAGLVVSDRVDWTSQVTTTADGSFALDLPASGTYYLALAGSPGAEKALAGEDDQGYYAPASNGGELGRRGGVVVEGNYTVVVTLRVR